jgi:hypothetical protein
MPVGAIALSFANRSRCKRGFQLHMTPIGLRVHGLQCSALVDMFVLDPKVRPGFETGEQYRLDFPQARQISEDG